MTNWDNTWRLWTMVFCVIASIGIILFYAPLFGKKTLSLEDYLLRMGASFTFLGIGIAKLCRVFGLPDGWQHPFLAVTSLSAAVGIMILIIKYRHSKGTAALQEYLYQRKGDNRGHPST